MKTKCRNRFALVLVLCCAALSARPVFGQDKNAPAAGATQKTAGTKKPMAAMLPDAFAGWTITGTATNSKDPSSVDSAQAGVLKEYGFTDSSEATYTNGDNKLTLKAARFQDATGAYGAFTYYRQPQMKVESVGTMAASSNERMLFFKANVLVEAKFLNVTAMSAASLREFADALPTAEGAAATLPSLPSYLPRNDLVPNTAKYVAGPLAYANTGLQISPQTVDFARGAELMTAKVRSDAGVADLVLVNYPTPQIAMDRIKAFQTANPKDQNATYAVKRSGPIVATVVGSISEGDARKLLSQVNYEAEVTWNEYTGLGKKDNIGSIVVGAITLAFIVFTGSLGFGAIFGFGRVFFRKILPARFAPREEQAEFTRLHLGD
jgi:hypothetical protein